MVRTIYIYLYRYLGEPRYVGQTPNVEKRDRAHIRNSRGSSFERFLAKQGRDKFTLEIVRQVEDFPLGKKANYLENQMMGEFGTYRPGEPGYNQSRAGIGNNLTAERYAAMRAAQRAQRVGKRVLPQGYKHSTKTRARISAALKGKPVTRTAEHQKKLRESLAKVAKDRIGQKLSEKHIAAIAEGVKRAHKTQHLFGPQIWSEQRRQEARERMRGVSPKPEVIAAAHTPKARAKLSASLRGRCLSSEHLAHCIEAARRPERRDMISKKLKGIKRTPEQIENNRRAQIEAQNRPEVRLIKSLRQRPSFIDCWESQHLLAPAA